MRPKDILTLQGLPRLLQVGICLALGAAAGAGAVVAAMGRAASYLSDKPETCINCHVMTDAYASWQTGSHALVAGCNDCHVPHSNPVAQYGFKAMDGIKHSTVFTLGTQPQVLSLSAMARPVVQANCLRCHADVMQMVRLAGPEERPCWTCHTNFHGKARSLSASPIERRPPLPFVGLPWPR